MQPTRTLQQINSSLGSIYDPQVQSYQNQINDLPNQVQSEEQGLQAKQTQAFGDILNGARARGTGVAFGGIPLQEQAQYTASTYLPALAQLHTAQKQQTQSLQDAINSLNANRYTQSEDIYQNEQNRAFQAQQAAQAAAAQRAATASPSFGDLFSQMYGQQPAAPQDPTQQQFGNGKTLQNAHDSIQQLMETRNTPLIARTYQAIQQAAARGSDYDRAKLALLQQLYGNSLAKNHIGAGQSDLVNQNMARF